MLKANTGKYLRALSLFCCVLLALNSYAQINSSDRKLLRKKEDSLQQLAAYIILDSFPGVRMRADSLMTRTFVRALQVKNSFYYPFDSVQGVSKLYAPDSSFRILTWNVTFSPYYSRQRGAIQIRTSDGSLKLFPLRDVSEFTGDPMDSTRTKSNWIGAVYYDIAKTTYNGKNFYTLIGYDYNSVMSSKKWIEVMSFDKSGEPVFGENKFFSYEKDSIRKQPAYRYSLEYKKQARAILQYDPELKLILIDHLISENDQPDNRWTYVPDGDYEAFTWQNGKWVHIDKVYNYKLQDGQAPVGDPLLDPSGNRNEQKLQEKSDKNKKKKDGLEQ
jgi:hypothetical protein